MAAPLGVSVKPGDWARIKRELSGFQPALAVALRRQIKSLGEDAVSGVQETVRRPAPTGGGSSIGSRDAIARATRLSLVAGGAGVQVVTGNVRNGFSKAYNKGSFRHPVYGGSAMVEQKGRPYFGAAINKSVRAEVLVLKFGVALDAAVRAIGGKG